jgi:hypothetical protein
MNNQGQQQSNNASTSLPHCGRVPTSDGFWSWQQVEDRMVEAMRHWWRSSDRESRFALGGRISSVWRQYFATRRDLAGWEMLAEMQAVEPGPLPLSRGDMARMVEASEWLAAVPERDRRLVIAVLVKLASGAKVVPWLVIWKALGRGKPGPEGLRSRYSRGLTCIANALNGGKLAGKSVNPATDNTRQI